MLAAVEEWIGQAGDVEQQDMFLFILSHNYSSETNLILKIQTRQILWKEKGEFVGAGFIYVAAKSLFVWRLNLLNHSRAKKTKSKPWSEKCRVLESLFQRQQFRACCFCPPWAGGQGSFLISLFCLPWSPFSISLSKMQWKVHGFHKEYFQKVIFLIKEGAIWLDQLHPRFALWAPSSCRAASGQL